MTLKNHRYVFVLVTTFERPEAFPGADGHVYMDEHSLPGEISSIDVRKAKQQPGRLVLIFPGNYLGYMPVQSK